MMLELRRPTLDLLPRLVAALEAGWSPDNVRGRSAADEALRAIAQNPQREVERMWDPDGRAPPVTMPDGSTWPRLPGVTLWIWDGEFCGTANLRWQPGTSALPDYVLGHIGYAIVPWKRGRGCATEALRQLLPYAWNQGLDHVELTTDADNAASQKVITANGGHLIETFRKPAMYGSAKSLRFRIRRPPNWQGEESV
jgi:predicted acetyltransferase